MSAASTFVGASLCESRFGDGYVGELLLIGVIVALVYVVFFMKD